MSDAETYFEKGIEALERAESTRDPRADVRRRDLFAEAHAYFHAANTCLRLTWSRPPVFKMPEAPFECPTEGCRRIGRHAVGECRSEP
jgi:hypothetical protein